MRLINISNISFFWNCKSNSDKMSNSITSSQKKAFNYNLYQNFDLIRNLLKQIKKTYKDYKNNLN